MLLKISSAKWQPFCPGGYELAPARWQVITCIDVDLLTISSLKKQWNLNQNSTIITQEKAFENVVYKRWPFFHAAINRPISQIPQCIKQLSHNAPFCNIVHISVTKWYIVGYGTDALWDLWDWLLMERVFPWSLTWLTVAPVAPCCPRNPGDPRGPGSPWGPLSPCGPEGPKGPGDPGIPGDPTKPGEPSGPGGPCCPVNPVAITTGPLGGIPGGPRGPLGPAGPASPAGPLIKVVLIIKSKPIQNGHHFVNYYIHFLEWRFFISVRFSLAFVRKGPENTEGEKSKSSKFDRIYLIRM